MPMSQAQKVLKKVERNNRHEWQVRQEDCEVTIEFNRVEVADLVKDCFSGPVRQKPNCSGFKGGWEERKWLQNIKNSLKAFCYKRRKGNGLLTRGEREFQKICVYMTGVTLQRVWMLMGLIR